VTGRVDVAFRRGQLRVSPHLYNTEADVGRALEVLDGRMAQVDSG
jgi:selenocysteine lyase/cysteine desulfurase